jgi:hypothetical protein
VLRNFIFQFSNAIYFFLAVDVQSCSSLSDLRATFSFFKLGIAHSLMIYFLYNINLGKIII